MPPHMSLADWIASDAITFAVDLPASLDAAVDRVVGSIGESVELLALGEALHGTEEILEVRNQMFQRLVEAHAYSAVVIEVTSPGPFLGTPTPRWLLKRIKAKRASRCTMPNVGRARSALLSS